MNIREELLKEHSRAQSDKIALWIAADKTRVHPLVYLFLNDEYRVIQRAAAVLSLVAECRPDLLLPYLDQLLSSTAKAVAPEAVKRNIIRLLQFIDIPERLHGVVMNVCFDYLTNPAEAVAVRCFSMTVLCNLCKYYPDIKGELVTAIEDVLENNPTPGLKARGKKILKTIKTNK